MPGVTISAGYGASGSSIAAMVADRLGLPLLDRAISVAIAAQLNVTVAEAEAGSPNRSFIERLLSFMSPLANDTRGAPDLDGSTPMPTLNDEGAAFREEAERIMREAFERGAVVLGRAGAAAFRDRPDILRVRLFGADDARIVNGAAHLGVDQPTARQQLKQVDGARDQYVRRLYRISVDDPSVFTMQLDSTTFSPEACAEIIVTAYRALGR
jgi:cytidylate kinase